MDGMTDDELEAKRSAQHAEWAEDAAIIRLAEKRLSNPTPVDQLFSIEELERQHLGSMDGEDFVRSLGFDDVADEAAAIKKRRSEES